MSQYRGSQPRPGQTVSRKKTVTKTEFAYRHDEVKRLITDAEEWGWRVRQVADLHNLYVLVFEREVTESQ